MENMQSYIDYIFNNVWCKAKNKKYDVNSLFKGNKELKDIIIELDTSELKGAEFFLKGLQLIFEDFKSLKPAQIKLLKHWYQSNNNIELCCLRDSSVSPVTYADISAAISSEFSKHLKDFYKNLYSQDFLALESIKNRVGDIDEHYQRFMSINKKGKCPFCGINIMKGIYHTKREAYDHYLPKDKYPFNSINFYNLVPACHECNSSYKLSINPLLPIKNPLISGASEGRKAFYPFSSNTYSIKIEMVLSTSNWNDISPDDIQINMKPNSLREMIDTWLDVYGIDERYKAKCCGESDGKGWIVQVLDEWKHDGREPDEFLKTLSRQTRNTPYCDDNFLKKPFLDACQKRGLFEV
tara:strand:- start:2008 stop:3066 length:1059 start_codon:yes stop_codon:yes gene_type:complete